MTADHKFDLDEIKNRSARQRLQQALEYKRRIDVLMSKQPGPVKLRLLKIAARFDPVLDRMFQLSKGFDALENHPVLKRNRFTLWVEIELLKRRLAKEADPRKKSDLQSALNARQELLGYLQTVKENSARVDKNLSELLIQIRKFYAVMQALDRQSNRDKR